MGDELGLRRHVYPVHVGVPNRRGRRGEVDFPRAAPPRHLDELLAGGAPDDGVVDEEDVPTVELELYGVQLSPNALLPKLLAGHDERPRDVSVLDEALAVGKSQGVGDLE